MSALTLYGTTTASTTLSTANVLAATSGGAETHAVTTGPSSGNGYVEVFAQAAISSVNSTLPSPSGKGFLYDTTALEGGGFATGNWSASIAMADASGSGPITSVVVRAYKRSSGGSFTLIGTLTLSSTTISSSRNAYSLPATSFGSVTFATGDKLYVDCFLQANGWGSDAIWLYESTSATAGVSGDVQIITSTFTPAGTLVNKDITARGKISAFVAKDITARGKLSGTATHDVTARGKIGNTTSRDVSTRGKVSALTNHDVTARGKISQVTQKDLSVRGKVGATVYKDITVRGKVSAHVSHDVTVRGKVGLFATHDVTVRGKVGVLAYKDIVVRGKIAPFANHDISTRGKVSAHVSHDVTVRGQIITRNTSGKITCWANGTGTVAFDHFRATQYPDPALSLAPVLPRDGTSLVEWNDTVVAGTSVGIDLSTDGVNWTDVSALNGQAFPFYASQPDPIIDGFTTNSSANYIQTARTGGSAATALWDTANSRLVLTGGVNAYVYYNPISHADVDFFVDMDQSDAGGLVWRLSDSSDFYALVIADSLSSAGTPNTMTLFRIASNVQTQLAQSAISLPAALGMGTIPATFVRGIHRRFRVSMLGSIITASFEGTALISYTDATPLTTGHVGVFNNGGTSHYSQFWLQPLGDYVSGIPAGDIVTAPFIYTRARLATTTPTATPQLLDLTTMATGPNIRNGVAVTGLAYNSAFIGKSTDDLAKTSNYNWFVALDQTGNKILTFQSALLAPAPWIAQSTFTTGYPSDVEVDSNLVVETAANTTYRNRQTVTGVIGSSTFTDPFVGDGQKTSFTLRYPVAPGTVPVITKNGQAQTVGLKGLTGYQWYYAVGDAVIAQDTSGTVLQAIIDLLQVVYTGTYTTSVTVNNGAAQETLAAVAKSSGIVEAVEDVSAKMMDVATATTYANQLLDLYCITGRTFTFKTYRDGLTISQALTAFFTEFNLIDAQLLIIEVDITMQTQPGGNVLYGYVVTGSELPYIKSWNALLASNMLQAG